MTSPMTTGTVPPLSPEEEDILRCLQTGYETWRAAHWVDHYEWRFDSVDGLFMEVVRSTIDRLAARTPRETPAGAVKYEYGGALYNQRVQSETPAGAVEALLTVDEAIGHALLETDHLPGMARRGPYIRRILEGDGWSLTRSVDVERWQRIETAARAYLAAEAEPHGSWALDTESEKARFERDSRLRAGLRDALGEG